MMGIFISLFMWKMCVNLRQFKLRNKFLENESEREEKKMNANRLDGKEWHIK